MDLNKEFVENVIVENVIERFCGGKLSLTVDQIYNLFPELLQKEMNKNNMTEYFCCTVHEDDETRRPPALNFLEFSETRITNSDINSILNGI